MGKYDFPLELDTKNSLSVIIKFIHEKSRILEFGPANGRLTKYLKNELNCIVDIVEIDLKAGSEASKFANISCIGNEEGNIENYKWFSRLKDEQYDFIIFADVLEHLYYPARVLEKCKQLLKNNGHIIVSIPNIAHNSIIIELINNKFMYTSVGLLDNTHIRFFTEESFLSMIKNIDLQLVFEEAITAQVGETEAPVNYQMVESGLAKYLKTRNKGNVYQYIFGLQKRNDDSTRHIMVNVNDKSSYKCECFIQEVNDNEFCEEKKIVSYFSCNNVKIKRFFFSFLNSTFHLIQRIRLDPINSNCVIKINHILLYYKGGVKEPCNFYTNGKSIAGYYFFFDNDPQIIITNHLNEVVEGIELEYQLILYDDENINLYLGCCSNNEKLKQENEKLKQENAELKRKHRRFL